MKKNIKLYLCVTLLTLMIPTGSSGEAIAGRDSFNVATKFTGFETDNNLRVIAGATPTVFASIDKRAFKKQWRGEGTGTLKSDSIFPITWNLSLDIQFYKNGHSYTGASFKEDQVNSISGETKWVEGDYESDFGTYVVFGAKDDNNVFVGSVSDSIGNPF